MTSSAAVDRLVGGDWAGDEQPAGDRAGEDWATWAEQIRRLTEQRDALILAHNYQAPEIQDVSDHVGDSLARSRLAPASTSSTIEFPCAYFTAASVRNLAPALPA